ncbi:signal transduction histidine kinase [Paenibacillus phyllosphaerae]|uniref:histidine kinase n=1 Tax=Paenibacillus phyllosphaerae TaxID=274593 RepID=A0A7W5FPV8_9BACL|nr:sensor histidine kinase [Paenibacillus phyllosphaerae]MBB3112826.1 signal transduction histidine kinase [Paenibacillus phyllosphaerae]
MVQINTKPVGTIVKARFLVFLAFILISTLIFGIVGFTILQPSRTDTMNEASVINLDESQPWQVHLGDLPMEAGKPVVTAGHWQPLRAAQNTEEGRSRHAVFWLKLEIPAFLAQLRDPVIWVQKQSSFEVYIDREHYLGLKPEEQSYRHPRMWSMAQLPNNGQMKELLIRTEPRLEGLRFGQYEIGNGKSILLTMVKRDLFNFIYVFFLGLLAVAAFLYYLRSRKDHAFLGFGLLTASAAAAHLLRSDSIQYLPIPDFVIYWGDIPGVIGTGSFMLFLYHFAGQERPRIFLVQAGVYGMLTLLLTVLAYTLPYYTFLDVHRYLILSMFVISFITSARYMVRRYRDNPDRETGWILGGLFCVTLFMFLHVSNMLVPGVAANEMTFASTLQMYLMDNAAGFGVLLFALSIGMAMVTRIARIRDEHEQLNLHLEQMVERRTDQLEKANRLLEHSIQERSEAMAELFVLEERNRIAGDIHDVVGHTLTATVLQIDAASRLIRKQDERGLEKLDLSADLIRKSLQDIRESVHMMKLSNQSYDLADAMRVLECRTEQAAGVMIEREIGELPELSLIQKKVLYHALQEGLTNGIRHGAAGYFHYELQAGEGEVRFTLWNDGRPYAREAYGFGLTNMLERVRQIGGTLEVMSPEGRPYQIIIRFPY